MSILDTSKSPGSIRGSGYAMQQTGATGGPRTQVALQAMTVVLYLLAFTGWGYGIAGLV